jgi:hypothetical protein
MMLEIRSQTQKMDTMRLFRSSKRRVCFRVGLGVLICTRIVKRRRSARSGPREWTLGGVSRA